VPYITVLISDVTGTGGKTPAHIRARSAFIVGYVPPGGWLTTRPVRLLI